MIHRFLSTTALLCAMMAGCGEDNTDPGKNGGGKGPGTGSGEQSRPVVGQVLPDWSEGYLDIHAINTGRGESSLYIFPDGTTMLVDAAGSTISTDDPIPPPPAKPNATADPAQTVINYTRYFIEAASGENLDYIFATHWHADHIGGPPDATMPTHSEGGFKLFGLTKVAAAIPFDRVIDRGLDYPRDNTAWYPGAAEYKKMVEWSAVEYSARREQFRVGVTDQLALQHSPWKYTNFTIRNLMANGVVWTGDGNGTRNTFPANVSDVTAASPDENIFSCAFHLKYGMFDHFMGGDLQYQGRSTHSWFDVEAPVAGVMSRVEVMKANHHATNNCNSDVLLNKLRPQAVIAHVWRDVQPHPATLGRMFDANADCQIFTTNMTAKNIETLGTSLTSRIKSMNGHVVVRVEPGGQRYYIYVLNDTNERYIVRKIFGPYQCE